MAYRVAVAGATGYIGGRLVPRLLADGHDVRSLARSPAKLAARDWAANPRSHIVGCDLTNVDAVAEALSGCDAAFYLVHSMASAGKDYASEDRRLAAAFAEGARRGGVGRIIYLGGLGADEDRLSEHLASRREVESALASTGIPVTVLRAAMSVSPMTRQKKRCE